MTYLLPDKAYTVLKWLALIALPAIATFCQTVLPVCGIDANLTSAVTTIITACATLIGALIAVSSATAKEQS